MSHLQDKAIDVGGSLVVVAAVVGVLWWLSKKAAAKVGETYDAVAESIPDEVKPSSDQNLIYKGWNFQLDMLDDGKMNDSTSVGSAFYNLTHWGQ